MTPNENPRDGENSGGRTARISRDAAGDPIGATLFFTAAELAALGVDPETTDSVNVSVEDGEVCLSDRDDDTETNG